TCNNRGGHTRNRSGRKGCHHGAPVNKRRKQMRRKRANDEAEVNAPPKVLRKDHAFSPAHSAYGGKSLAAMGLGAGSISSTPSAQGAPTAAKSVSDPDALSAQGAPTAAMGLGAGSISSRVREIDLRSLRGRVTERYLSTGVGRD
ncbi:hypothetical protein Tco_0208492, partial [Tanacetum coccineum]